MENPIKMDDLGGTPIFGNTHISLIGVTYKKTANWSVVGSFPPKENQPTFWDEPPASVHVMEVCCSCK